MSEKFRIAILSLIFLVLLIAFIILLANKDKILVKLERKGEEGREFSKLRAIQATDFFELSKHPLFNSLEVLPPLAEISVEKGKEDPFQAYTIEDVQEFLSFQEGEETKEE